MTNDIRHPEVTVQLIGEDSNAFNLLGRVQRELRRSGVDENEVRDFIEDATSGDWNDLVGVIMNWVNVE